MQLLQLLVDNAVQNRFFAKEVVDPPGQQKSPHSADSADSATRTQRGALKQLVERFLRIPRSCQQPGPEGGGPPPRITGTG